MSLWIERGAFLMELLALLFCAKVLRDVSAIRRGRRLNAQLTEHDNPAAALDLAGALLALVTALLGSLLIGSETWLGQASELAISGLAVLLILSFNGWLTDKAILRGIDDYRAIYEDRNVGVAACRAASVMATGLIIRGAFAHEAPWLEAISWVCVGQLALMVMALLYQWVTPYDDLAEIRGGNFAAALPLAGILFAVGLTVEAAIEGEPAGFSETLPLVLGYLAFAGVLLWLLRIFVDRVLMPGVSLSDEIAKDRNVGAGLLEASSFIACAELINYFLH